jgi:hypothetical protein
LSNRITRPLCGNEFHVEGEGLVLEVLEGVRTVAAGVLSKTLVSS